MAETDQAGRFSLSYAKDDKEERFATAAEAGRAFADTDAALRPRVIETVGTAARKIATTVTIGDDAHKSAPNLDRVKKRDAAAAAADGKRPEGQANTDVEFWTAYHARVAERTKPQADLGAEAQTGRASAAPENSIAADPPPARKREEDRFALPSTYHDRFIVTKGRGQQELFRSFDDARPAISDRGDSLSTRLADRGTAMDMIELAAHRGWKSLTAKGPQDFRREMWVEGMAQGLKVQGYRPSEKDQEEAGRRAQMIGVRSIERDDPGKTRQVRAQSQGRAAQVSKPQAEQTEPRPSYEDGLRGVITAIGAAPYRGREGAEDVSFVELQRDGKEPQRLWSVTLPEAVEKHDLKVGDRVTLFSPGVEPVSYMTRDRETGVEVERQGHRRLWDARDIERIEQREHVTGKMETDVSFRTGERSTELDAGIKAFAVGDRDARGPASVLAQMEARMLAEGVSDKDRAGARDHAVQMLADRVSNGQSVPVQTLANVAQRERAPSSRSEDRRQRELALADGDKRDSRADRSR